MKSASKANNRALGVNPGVAKQNVYFEHNMVLTRSEKPTFFMLCGVSMCVNVNYVKFRTLCK